MLYKEILEKKGSKSHTAVAKALCLLAPNFFPLWDESIAKAYECDYKNKNAPAVEKYITFSKIVKHMASKFKDDFDDPEKSIIKLIDEYNYSKFSQRWKCNALLSKIYTPYIRYSPLP